MQRLPKLETVLKKYGEVYGYSPAVLVLHQGPSVGLTLVNLQPATMGTASSSAHPMI